MVQPPFSYAERQFVVSAQVHDVRGVQIGQRPVAGEAVSIVDGGVFANIVDRLRMRPVEEQRQPLCESAFYFQLQCVIRREANRRDALIHSGELGKWAEQLSVLYRWLAQGGRRIRDVAEERIRYRLRQLRSERQLTTVAVDSSATVAGSATLCVPV